MVVTEVVPRRLEPGASRRSRRGEPVLRRGAPSSAGNQGVEHLDVVGRRARPECSAVEALAVARHRERHQDCLVVGVGIALEPHRLLHRQAARVDDVAAAATAEPPARERGELEPVPSGLQPGHGFEHRLHDQPVWRSQDLRRASGAWDARGVSTDDVKATPILQTLVGISFEDTFRAQEFLTAASGLASRGGLNLRDAVMVVKDDGGKTAAHETTDLQPARTALSGAMWAGLFGLILGGPVGWVAGIAVGAGTGALAAKVVDLGISDEWVAWFREAVKPGTVTVALLVEDLDPDALVKEAARFTGAELVYANLDDETIERVKAAFEA